MRIITLDLGGTFIKAALMSEKAEIIEQWKVPSPTKCLEDLLSALDDCVLPHLQGAEGLAISMPGRIDVKKGIACTGGAFDFIHDLKLVKLLEERYHVPVSIDNDGKCAANAENWIGSLKDVSSGVVYVLGTGIGGGIVIDNKVYRGFNYAAGELSCSLMDKRGKIEGKNWTVDSISTTGLLDAYKRATGMEEKLDGVEFFDRVLKKEEMALSVLRVFAYITARFFYDMQVILDVERYSIGGGISAQPILIDTIREEVDKIWDVEFTLPCIKPEVTVCEYGNNANLIGALKNFLDNKGE